VNRIGDVKPLCGGRFEPVTTSIGFIEAAAADVADGYLKWQRAISMDDPRGVSHDITELRGSICELLAGLPPLYRAEPRRHLFVPTRSRWTAYFQGMARAPDVVGPASLLADRLDTRALRVVLEPGTPPRDHGLDRDHAGVMLEVYGPRPTDFLNYERVVNLAVDGDRWSFDTSGTPLPFEDLDRYKRRRKRERFPPELLSAYLHELGVDAFDEDFYWAGGPAYLVEQRRAVDSADQELTYEEAQRSMPALAP
jgi:hypothetical protein